MKVDKSKDDGHYNFFEASDIEEEAFRELVAKRLSLSQIELPLMPHVSAKVLELTNSPDFSYKELTQIIITDQIISSKLLKMANSALLGTGKEITSLSQAIVRLGSRWVNNLVLSTSLSATISSEELYGPDGLKLWDHSVGCAFIAKHLAEVARLNPEEAFLAGLLHDIGKLVYISVSRGIIKDFPIKFKNIEDMLNLIIENDHANMGDIISREWAFPAIIRHCIRYHHSFVCCAEEQKLVMVISLADKICNYNGFGLNICNSPPWEDRTVELIGVEPEKVQEITESLPSIINEIRSLFGN